MQTVFVTGGTGFMGRNLIVQLVRRGYEVQALARHGSEHNLPHGCKVVHGDALDKNSFVSQIPPAETFVQLVGVTHPNPAKKDEFRAVELGSARVAIEAAREAGIKHFVYVSVAQPAPVMKFYVEVRAEAEKMVRESDLNATILRPWYVLGPGGALAVGLEADVLADGAHPRYARIGAKAGAGHDRSNGWRIGPVG